MVFKKSQSLLSLKYHFQGTIKAKVLSNYAQKDKNGKRKKKGEKTSHSNQTLHPSTCFSIFYFLIDHYNVVKISTVIFFSVTALFGLQFCILTISSLKVVFADVF